jgi:hypothetical protein
MKFPALALRILKPEVIKALPVTIISFDPGETTGIAIWQKTEWFPNGSDEPRTAQALPKLFKADQLATKTVAAGVPLVVKLFDEYKPDQVVIEDYRVYGWKTEDHAWAALHTPRLIGAIETICTLRGIPFCKQSAQVAKGFCTDDKLHEWGYYDPSLRHGRDAIRHGAYYCLFGSTKKYDAEGFVLK